MQPGLSRALPMGILGFLAGTVLLIVVRALQSLDPIFDPGLAIVFGSLFSAGFFIWGMGGFDPRMREHAHGPEDEARALALAEAPPGEEEPTTILSGFTWQIVTWLLILLLGIAAFALIPGSPTLQIVRDPVGNTAAIGFVEMELLGETFIVSELVLLLVFVIVMFLSLFAVAGGLGWLFFRLAQGVTEVKQVERTALAPSSAPQLPAPEAAPATASPLAGLIPWLVAAVGGVVGFTALDLLLGLQTPTTPGFAYGLAAGNLVALVVLLLRMVWSLSSTGIKGGLARFVFRLLALVVLLSLSYVLIWDILPALDLLVLAAFNLVAFVIFFALRAELAVTFAAIFSVLFVIFYYVAIGLVIGMSAPALLFNLTFFNVLVLAILIARPRLFANSVGGGSRWIARQLRRLPNALQ